MFALFFLCMAVGFIRIGIAAPSTLPTGYGTLTGRIAETPEQTDYTTWRITLSDAALDGESIDGRVKLFAAFDEAPEYGQVVTAYAGVMPSDEKYQTNDRYRGVFTVAFARGTATIVWRSPPDLYGVLLQTRRVIGERIDTLFSNQGGAAKGMLLGDKSDMDEETLTAFRDAGLAHLLAVSGLHVSVLAGAVSLLFRRNAWVRFFAVALFCALYAALTAFSPSVVRAGLMIVVLLLSQPLKRRPDPISTMSAALACILFFHPFALWYAGFQLSFTAVYALILLAPILQKPIARLGSVASGMISASAAVVVGTLPASAYFFNRVQFLSLVTNLFVLLIVPVFLIPAFIGTALSFLWYPLGNAVCMLPRFALDVIFAVATYGGSISAEIKAPSAPAYLLYLAAILPASRLCLRSRRRRALYALSVWTVSVLLWIIL
jgi:competence protein ComEC